MARLRVSIVFASGARIGPGKARLLESIRDTGSISAALAMQVGEIDIRKPTRHSSRPAPRFRISHCALT
jgi:hypothetical protein